MKQTLDRNTIDQVIAAGPYTDHWQSLCQHPIPQWFQRGKLGIFIHWGIYSVPAFGNEWYSRNMYDPNHREFAHHLQTYGKQDVFGYKDFIPMFRAENFDPQAWAAFFKESGARFVMPVAEHHDGFAMYQTAFNRWNAANMGPCRDVVGELKQACEAENLTFCASTHRAEHYFFMNMGRCIESDVNDEKFADFYGPAVYCPEFGSEDMGPTTENPYGLGPNQAWMEDWLLRTCELVDAYQPSALYFDWWVQNRAFKPYLKKLAAYYYNRAIQWGKEVTVQYKHHAFAPGVGVFDVERGALTDISPVPWQTDTAIGKESWGYRADNAYKSSRQIVCDLVDIVSKNGTLLLNIGPRADGTFTPEETKVLQDLGAWLRIHGEGIYDTTPWTKFGEGAVNAQAGAFQDGEEKAFTAQDFRFTYKAGALYAFQMRPDGAPACIRSLAKVQFRDLTIASVELLGYGPVQWQSDETGLQLQVPADVDTALPICFKITMD